MEALSNAALQQLFTEARTHYVWEDTNVTDAQLRQLYDLLKFGPTSANLSPARFVFLRKGKKDKLLPCVSETNVDKVKSAPITVIIAYDEKFYDQQPKLFPAAAKFRENFANNPEAAHETAVRNGTLQGAYLILAARALGLNAGPMSGFDANKVNAAFFAGTSHKANFLCNLGYGTNEKLFPRLPRLDFEEACTLI